jgi:hypothetical protein
VRAAISVERAGAEALAERKDYVQLTFVEVLKMATGIRWSRANFRRIDLGNERVAAATRQG